MRTRHTSATVAAAGLVLAMLLGGCAAGAAEPPEAPSIPSVDPLTSQAPSAQAEPADSEPVTVAGPASGSAGEGGVGEPSSDDWSADPIGEEAPEPASHETAWSFETQNGTMRMTVPADWTLTDLSASAINHDSQQQWNNLLRLTSPGGVQLQYYDGYGSDVGPWFDDFEVVETQETASGQLAIAYWGQAGETISADVILGGLTDDGRPADFVRLPDIIRNHTMGIAAGADWGGIQQFGTRAAAEEFLASDAAQQALDVIASVELIPVPQYEMP